MTAEDKRSSAVQVWQTARGRPAGSEGRRRSLEI